MKTSVKLLGFAVASAAILTACTGTGLPGATGTPAPDQPGFSGRITKNNVAVSGRKVFLKLWTGATAGQFGGTSSNQTDISATTDSNGNYFLPLTATQAKSGGIFSVAYDASNTATGGSADKVSAGNLTDEVQWFYSTPASFATSNTVPVSFDIGWNVAAFQPANGATVQGPDITFTLPQKAGATQYEVVVNKGQTAGSGEKAFGDKGTANTFMWKGAAAGNYIYTAKVFTEAGVSGVQASSPNLTFTVAGAQ